MKRDSGSRSRILRSACRLYDRCSSHISDDDACMLQPWIQACRDIAKAFPASRGQAPRIAWTSPSESTRAWVDSFMETVASLQEKVDVLSKARQAVRQSLSLLSASDGARDLETISTKPLQDVVDRLALEGFQGLNQWVASLDGRCRVGTPRKDIGSLGTVGPGARRRSYHL